MGGLRLLVQSPINHIILIALCGLRAFFFLLLSSSSFLFNVSDNTKSHPDRFFFGPTGYKRSGLNLYAGFRLNF